MPDLATMHRINALKGRPRDQIGSVTTDPSRAHLVFDWRELDRERIEAVMAEFLALGPTGFRGPASALVAGTVLIGHADERANRQLYPYHLPCSTSIVAFHRGGLVLERHGSLGVDDARAVAAAHGMELTLAPGTDERLPVRWPSADALRSLAA